MFFQQNNSHSLFTKKDEATSIIQRGQFTVLHRKQQTARNVCTNGCLFYFSSILLQAEKINKQLVAYRLITELLNDFTILNKEIHREMRTGGSEEILFFEINVWNIGSPGFINKRLQKFALLPPEYKMHR